MVISSEVSAVSRQTGTPIWAGKRNSTMKSGCGLGVTVPVARNWGTLHRAVRNAQATVIHEPPTRILIRRGYPRRRAPEAGPDEVSPAGLGAHPADRRSSAREGLPDRGLAVGELDGPARRVGAAQDRGDDGGHDVSAGHPVLTLVLAHPDRVPTRLEIGR